MFYREFIPSTALQRFIKCFWVLERDFQDLDEGVDVLPDSYSEVIFNFGDACQLEDGPVAVLLPMCYRVGLLEHPLRLRARGVLKTVGIRFYAWGFHALFGADAPVSPLLGDVVYALDRDWQQVADTLQSLIIDGDALAIAYLDAQLAAHSQGAAMVADAAITGLPAWINPGHQSTVARWADASHFSRRQLERKLQKLAGVSPKALTRRVRFERVRDHLCHQPECDLATLAHAYGYADQAHFGRDFKYFTHRTPRQFVAGMRDVPEALRYGVAFCCDSE